MVLEDTTGNTTNANANANASTSSPQSANSSELVV